MVACLEFGQAVLHPLVEVVEGFAPGNPMLHQVLVPVLDIGPGNGIPGPSLPVAEIDFLQAAVHLHGR